ncbi:hypothetical protein CRH09_05695 [Nocardia terpenica]|uniref:ESX-1 secretion-associated protein n=1 Tax=Nocardia terpenica TaxID=455432 RepID=A0A291RDY1_9NOCA|nr:hypothetical protein CRH09_05695 [Nocardia terpenica]
MDVAALHAIARDLRWSADVLDESARVVGAAAQRYDAADAGRDYRTRGDRLGRALDGVGTRIQAWATCVRDTGELIGTSATGSANTDGAGAAGITSAGGTLV